MDRDKDRGRDRSRDRDRKRDRSFDRRENGKDSKRIRQSRSRSRDRDGRVRSRSRDRIGNGRIGYGEKDSWRDRDRDRDMDRDRDRERNRERDRDRDHIRDRDRDRDRERDRDRGMRDRDRDRERDRDLDRDRERDRDRGRDDGKSSAPYGLEKGGKASNNEEEDAAIGNGHDLANGAKKVEPLSLEEILKKKQQEQEELAKPKFLSKKQREELALKRRQEEVDLQRAKAEEMRKAHQSYMDTLEAERRREADRKAEEERRRRHEDRERQKELELIKQQYLGGEKVKKKILKPSEKFRFNFDWEATDDTSRDLNPLYNNTHEAALLFGRGLRAGIDRREQKKQAAEFEKEVMRKMRESQGIAETKEDRKADRERARAADAYDGFDRRIEKHWTEKTLEEMTERDWRIFREDFNISYKGSGVNNAMPIRNWEEASLPKDLMKSIKKLNYEKPSPIQMAAIPLGLQQRDVIGVAETGSGKTAAFVLPMLVYIMKQPVMTEEIAVDGPYAVVLAPTRELAQQIEEEAKKLAEYTGYRMVSVVGGQSIEEQGYKLRKGCEIILATPGRLKGLLGKSLCRPEPVQLRCAGRG
eukprot:jgi/Botrbrau1/3861/Bobra.0183s0086.1